MICSLRNIMYERGASESRISPHRLAPKSEYASGCILGVAIKAQAEQPAWNFHVPSIQLCWYALIFRANFLLQIMSAD